MGLHRSLRQVQAARDLPVGETAAEEAEDVPLPGGQGLDAGAGRRAAAGLGARTASGEMRDDPGRDLR